MSAKTKVSIVEDDINMRKSLEFALSEYEEFEIKCFKSALDALKKMDMIRICNQQDFINCS